MKRTQRVLGAHLASAGVNWMVILAAWRSRKPVEVRQPEHLVSMFSVSNFRPNAFSGRPVTTPRLMHEPLTTPSHGAHAHVRSESNVDIDFESDMSALTVLLQ